MKGLAVPDYKTGRAVCKHPRCRWASWYARHFWPVDVRQLLW